MYITPNGRKDEERIMATRKHTGPSAKPAEAGRLLLRSPSNLADPSVREQLTPAATEAMVRLSLIWQLTTLEACGLLGGISERSFARLKSGTRSGALSQDELTRVSALSGIFKGLHLLFSEPLADEWPKLSNAGPIFKGATPVDTMIAGGIPAMIASRRYVDALRGGL